MAFWLIHRRYINQETKGLTWFLTWKNPISWAALLRGDESYQLTRWSLTTILSAGREAHIRSFVISAVLCMSLPMPCRSMTQMGRSTSFIAAAAMDGTRPSRTKADFCLHNLSKLSLTVSPQSRNYTNRLGTRELGGRYAYRIWKISKIGQVGYTKLLS